jgi:HK97 family phage major capsid protein
MNGFAARLILFGDLRAGYTFRQAGQTVVRKTVDRFFENNETAFASFSRCGGYSTNAGINPTVSLKMAAS